MISKKALIAHTITLLTAIGVIALDQWSKNLVVEYLSPPETGRRILVIGEYLTLYYIQNHSSAMGLFSNGILLAVLITGAFGILVTFYLRLDRSSPLLYRLLFGMIIGGAAGNIIDRIVHSGYVVDFIFFRLPQAGLQFYVFNVADAAISVGLVLLCILMFFESIHHSKEKKL